MYFCTEQGLWILSPISSSVVMLDKDPFTANMDRRNDYRHQQLSEPTYVM